MAPRTRPVEKQKYRNFIRKSDEFSRSAQQAMQRGDWNAAVSHAIHAAICAADALIVFYLGKRSASQSHEESLRLLSELKIDRRELDRNIAHLAALLRLKTAAEYEDRLFEEKDAASAQRHTERFRGWALAKIAI